jgi:hypothetical protein
MRAGSEIISIFSLWTCHFPAASACGVYISKLIRYSRASDSYRDVLDRELLLTRQLLNQDFLVVMLKSSLRKFTVATMTWLSVTEYLYHKWPRMCSVCRNHNSVLSSFKIYHRVSNYSNTKSGTCGAATTYSLGAPELTNPIFVGFVLLDL